MSRSLTVWWCGGGWWWLGWSDLWTLERCFGGKVTSYKSYKERDPEGQSAPLSTTTTRNYHHSTIEIGCHHPYTTHAQCSGTKGGNKGQTLKVTLRLIGIPLFPCR